MDKSALKQIDELNRMSSPQLRKRWTDLYGTDASRFSRAYMIRRLAYRIQELAYGGLSREAKATLKNLADGKRAPDNKPKRQHVNIQPGTRLLREWHGNQYEVVVEQDGFRYNGKRYRSLSAVARTITGAYWSGNRFFGLTSPTRKRKERA